MPSKNTSTPTPHEWIAGKHTCLDIIKHHPGCISKILITQSLLERIKTLIPPHIPTHIVTTQELSKRTQCHHQGIAILAHATYQSSLKTCLEQASDRATFLAVDTVDDSNNLGAIYRCAAAFNVHTIILTQHHIPGGAAWKKIASGALFQVRLCIVPNMKDALVSCKKNGFWCVGLDERGTNDHPITHDRLVYVVGGEAKGIRPLVQNHCDTLLKIPTSSTFQTLNMSHACAIVLAQRFAHTNNQKPHTKS